MAFSVMVWLVNPGEYQQQEAEEEWAAAGRDEAPGAATGANTGRPLPRLWSTACTRAGRKLSRRSTKSPIPSRATRR
jgi:hypothetical protein